MNLERIPFAKPYRMTLALRAHTALAVLLDGTGTMDELIDVSVALNVVHGLMELGKVDRNLRKVIDQACDGLIDAQDNQPDGKRRIHVQLAGARPAEALVQIISTYDRSLETLARETVRQAAANRYFRIVDNQAYMPEAALHDV